ncbi:MAG: class I SAM-dependent methyltransferase [Pseudomonadota bacterium]|jgi:ubiquinone/menaquinone biosynthesis C-methylase UbiE
MKDRKAHWEEVYSIRKPDEVGWYQADPRPSLELIEATGAGPDAAVIDVGGGASTLVDKLLERGFGRLTVLDISAAALEAVKARLGARAAEVRWVVADITRFEPPQKYDIWHDRAVFHFLTDAADRRRYLDTAARAIDPGGHLIIATFALDGPEECSGLEVVRYSPESLQQEVGGNFSLAESFAQAHMTPSGGAQHFVFCRFVRQ